LKENINSDFIKPFGNPWIMTCVRSIQWETASDREPHKITVEKAGQQKILISACCL